MKRHIFCLLVLIHGLVFADDKVLLWGDTHLHTNNSFDAFLNNNVSADPETAFRWAKGEPVIHPYNRSRVQIGQPLDFLVVSDHAEFFGGFRSIYLNGIANSEEDGPIDRLLNWYKARVVREAIDNREGPQMFSSVLPETQSPEEAAKRWSEAAAGPLPPQPGATTDAWLSFADAADHHNQPGKFTAFIGWEWSSTPGGANLHRIIVTNADGAAARTFEPLSSVISPYPEDLFNWLDRTSKETGVSFLSIPHNSNLSKGLMFSDRTLRGEALTAEQARQRATWERVVEMTQIKGDSETHPTLSPDDTFADFERYNFYLQKSPEPYKPGAADFVRPALRTGLALERSLGINPFDFGLIGSTDSHTGLSSAEEPNFWGKMATDSTPETKAQDALAKGPTGWTMSASGLAAVWAEENSRDSILAAMKRREVYATTGPRIRVQFFVTAEETLAASPAGGAPLPPDWKTTAGDLSPMGSDVKRSANQRFIVQALQDPQEAPLDRIQIIKGWIDAVGETHEKIFDVAWSTPRNLWNGAPEPVPDEVDRRTGRRTGTTGAAELSAVWIDPESTADEKAFYYARVLQVPTARHSLLDALALGKDRSQEGPDVIQERAYTSPIWVGL